MVSLKLVSRDWNELALL